jgi:ferredoxin
MQSMLRVVVDLMKCESNGLCVAQAPQVFGLTDDDELQVLNETPAVDQLAAVERAVQMCPKQALSLVETMD